ncbi:MAG: DNA polymerase I [Flavobacteriaceae bacterium]|nr:DNA polymerase I [Flavobacteriaceae bacterium]
MENKKRLFLIDAYALIFRGYYAFIKNPRINSKGLDTSAILGFTNSLFDVIKRERPEYIAVCFDKGGSHDRIEIFPEYKANRDETPEAIKMAVPYIQEILNALGICIMVKEGYEADDIIGTLAKKAEKENFETYMVTPDKDFAQLVNEKTFIYKPLFGGGYETWGIEEVNNKFETSDPIQVIDFLAMKGDSVDNIPGLPGVGDKTAKKFLKEYGSIENLLSNTDKIKGKLREKIEANSEAGLLSKKLATIITDVPVDFDSNKFKLSLDEPDKLYEIFSDLEFRRLAENFKKIFDIPIKKNTEEIKEKQPETSPIAAGSGQFSLFDQAKEDKTNENSSIRVSKKEISHLFQIIDTKISLKIFLNKLMKQPSVAFKLLLDNHNSLLSNLIGISFCWSKNKVYYIDYLTMQKNDKKILQKIKLFFEDHSIEKISENIKHDMKSLEKHDIGINGEVFDTMLAHYLINPDINHTTEVLSENYLNYSINQEESSIDNVCEKANIIFQLKGLLEDELKLNKHISLYKEIEIPLLRVLANMEIEGISLNVAYLNKLSKSTDQEIEKTKNIIYAESKEEFNISSPKQLGEILFDKMKIAANPKKTKTGQYSTSEEILSYLAKENDFVKTILEYRSLTKLQNTYIKALPNQISKNTGKIHTEYLQTVAATGRLSSINPNLQNIPIRTERGKEIRKAFIPRNKDFVILSADYSQIELRIIAALSEEENMINAFENNEDIHSSTAALVFNTKIKNVTSMQRTNAKTVNFGIIYGVSAFGLSNQTNLSRKEAKELIETYYNKYPKLKKYIASQISFAREKGYVETLLGRRRYLKDINSRNSIVRGGAERNAINAPIQGSAADIIKISMINIQSKLIKRKFQSKMLLQVHDELVFDVFKPELNDVITLVKDEMENAFILKVPLIVDIDYGENWLEAH